MPKHENTELDILRRRQSIFRSKITEEREAMRAGTSGPGAPVECETIQGEFTYEQTAAWVEAAKSIERAISGM